MFFSDRLFIRKMFLMSGDIALMFFSLFLALSVRKIETVSSSYYLENLFVFLPIFVFSIVIYILFDLYGIKMLQAVYRSVYYLCIAIATNFLLAIAFLYLFPSAGGISPKTVLVLYSALLFLLEIVWRFLYFDFFFSNKKYLKRVIIIGNQENCFEVKQLATPPRGVDYRLSGFVSVSEQLHDSPFENVPYLGTIKDLHIIIKEKKIDEIVIAFDYKNNSNFIKTLSDTLMLGIKIFEWPVFYEHVFQKVPTNQIDHFWFIYSFGENHSKTYERIKRFFDIIISIFGIALMVLLLPIIAFLIKTTSAGPIFYRQKRLGLGGNVFTLIKFRTMANDAEKNGAVWSSKGDVRITSVGKFLRKTRLDEFPQFFNILWGEMSLVGPRPERPEFLPILNEKIPFYYKRHMVKPGVTGFAQVMYPYAETVEDSLEKVGYDLFYIKNRSLYLYAKIVLLTIRTIATLKGQ